MSHVWMSTVDGDLLRADQIRQLNIVEGLHAVLIGGGQFLIADVEGRGACAAVAKKVAAAIDEGETRSHAAEIVVARRDQDWTVELRPLRETTEAATASTFLESP